MLRAQIVFRRNLPAIVNSNYAAFRYCEKRIMSLVVFRRCKKGIVCCNKWQLHAVCQFDECGFRLAITANMTLEFDIESVAKIIPKFLETPFGQVFAPGCD
jgi:hypothetical protein